MPVFAFVETVVSLISADDNWATGVEIGKQIYRKCQLMQRQMKYKVKLREFTNG